jgi:hypothetical protein
MITKVVEEWDLPEKMVDGYQLDSIIFIGGLKKPVSIEGKRCQFKLSLKI